MLNQQPSEEEEELSHEDQEDVQYCNFLQSALWEPLNKTNFEEQFDSHKISYQPEDKSTKLETKIPELEISQAGFNKCTDKNSRHKLNLSVNSENTKLVVSDLTQISCDGLPTLSKKSSKTTPILSRPRSVDKNESIQYGAVGKSDASQTGYATPSLSLIHI